MLYLLEDIFLLHICWPVTPDKRDMQVNIFAYFSMETYVVGIHRGTSNEYPQHIFLLRNTKKKKKYIYIIFWQKSALPGATVAHIKYCRVIHS